MLEKIKIFTCSAPVNIAILKYWGKRDENLILPLNDSISFTLDQNEMCATTTVAISKAFTQDRFWLNKKEENIENPRISQCIKEVKRRASKRKDCDADLSYLNDHIHIHSCNNFPTAAGLASSAAGYACLVFALSHLYELDCELSCIARLGSGSACRSMYGGVVQWGAGSAKDGTDSYARNIAPAKLWQHISVIICVANENKKKVGSTEGMLRSWRTSNLFQHRLQQSLPKRQQQMITAISDSDWPTLCDLVMQDSNEMHAVCMDTFPPCVYMNDTSHDVVNVVHHYNQCKTQNEKVNEKICYTFDAGPNACLFVPSVVASEVMSVLLSVFPQINSTNQSQTSYVKGRNIKLEKPQRDLLLEPVATHSMQYFIYTGIGEGPRLLRKDGVHLLDINSGLPIQDKMCSLEGGQQVIDTPPANSSP